MARLRSPLLAVLVLAPVFGEWLSTATPPLDSLLWPPTTILFVSLYGCGALLCREIARRRGLGLRGLILLAAAYAVWEEALVDRWWFERRPFDEGGLEAYSEVWHTNVILATSLTIFHVTVSIVSTIVVVELLFPGHRDRPWVSGRGLGSAAAAFFVLPPALFGEYNLDPLPQLVASAALMATLVLVGIRLRGSPSLWRSRSALTPERRGVVPVTFVATALSVFAVGLAGTSTPWPVTLLAVVAPLPVAAVILRTRVSGPVFGRDGLRVVLGVVAFRCVLAGAVGLAGRLDLTLGAVAVAYLLWRLRQRVRADEGASFSPSSP